MRVARNLRLSFGALQAHRLRTALAVGGAAIGVAGVLVLGAVGAGARARVLDQIERLGRTLLVVTPAPVPAATRLVRGGGEARTLVVADAAALLRGSTAIARVAPATYRNMVAKYGPIQNPTTVLGTTPDWLAIRRFALAAGRFFTESEGAARERVAVLGAEARSSLFPDTIDPVGRSIRIGTAPFVVVGVLEPRGMSASGTATEDDRILVPLETAMDRLFGVDELRILFIEAISDDAMDAAARAAAALLRVRHDLAVGAPDDFVIDNQRVVLNTQLAAQTAFQRLLAGLGLLALAVSGVGILSILQLSVRERRREIGLRVAVGARRSDLLVQFLAEALLLAGCGAAAGLLLGFGAARAVSAATSWDARVSAASLAVTIAAALLTGVCAGVLPAWRAAVVDPVDALQSE